MKIAIVHDWLTGLRGGERVLQAFLKMYPDADIYTLLHVPGATSPEIDARVKQTSFLQNIPGIRKLYRYFLPLYPLAISKFKFDGYDLVISLSHAAAKNVTVPKDVPHVSYCFSPMRYVWDQAEQYFGPMYRVLWPILLALREWDRKGGKRATRLVGISNFIGARIRCFYKRRADVIYPPVEASWIQTRTNEKQGEAFLYAGALVPYKRPDHAVEACTRLRVPLWIAGSGPELQRLKRIAGPNVHFLGRVTDEELADLYRRCRALLFPGTEDFGLIPLECLAAGRPVIGLHSGALRETLTGIKHWDSRDLAVQNPTGVFIRKDLSDPVGSLVRSIEWFMENETMFSAKDCAAQARKFGPDVFESRWYELMTELGLDDRQKLGVKAASNS